MASTLSGLSKRQHAAEEAWAREAQEVAAAAHRSRLEAGGAAGAARLARAAPASAPAASMLPAIAAQYLRLGTPEKAERRVITLENGFRFANRTLPGVCTGHPLFVRDVSMGTRLSISGSKWVASSGTVDGVSLFDVKGGVRLAEGAGSALPPQRAPPAAPEAVLQLGQMRFKMLPDLTPSRALVWGTVLAVWTIAGVVVKTTRALEISTVDDVKAKFGLVMSPYADRCQAALAPYREGLVHGQGSLKNSEMTTRLKHSMR